MSHTTIRKSDVVSQWTIGNVAHHKIISRRLIHSLLLAVCSLFQMIWHTIHLIGILQGRKHLLFLILAQRFTNLKAHRLILQRELCMVCYLHILWTEDNIVSITFLNTTIDGASRILDASVTEIRKQFACCFIRQVVCQSMIDSTEDSCAIYTFTELIQHITLKSLFGLSLVKILLQRILVLWRIFYRLRVTIL